MANPRDLTHDFTVGSVPRQLLRFASPLFLSSLLQVAYNMVDMIIVGRVTGKVGLSAVSVGGDVSNFLLFLSMGFSNAGQVILSQLMGAGQHDKLSRFARTMCTFLFSCALALSVVCFCLRAPILRLMNTPAESYDQTMAYATVSIVGLVFVYGYNMVSAILRGLGDSRHPFIFISIASVLNVLLDLLFVVGFRTGAMGAALATVISQSISFICCAVFLYRNQARLGLEFRLRGFFLWDRELLGSLIKLGVPMAIKSAAIHVSKLFVNSWINSFGVAVSAMAGIANKVNSISNLFSNAVNTAGSSMVGQNIGAKKYERVPQVMLTAFGVCLTIAVVISGVIVLFPRAVFGIFTDEADVMAIAMEYVPIAVLIFFGSAFRACMNALINGSGNYRVNFATAIFDGIVMRIGLSVLFGLVLDMGYMGFWLGDAVAGFTPFVIGGVYYFSGKWKTRKFVVKEE